MQTAGIQGTHILHGLVGRMSPESHDEVLRMVEARTLYFEWMYTQGTPAEFVKAFYEAFDDSLRLSMERDKGQISCKRGCHLCCRQTVNIFEGEAQLIAEYCKERGIPIPKTYLQEQLKHHWKAIAVTDVGWCTFLRDGECTIYAVRPIACRKYLVASPAEMCDTVKFPSSKGHKVAVVAFVYPEIEASAFAGVMKAKQKVGRLPEMLLPYSK